eukprot:1920747-Rhodomonas_salina.5
MAVPGGTEWDDVCVHDCARFLRRRYESSRALRVSDIETSTDVRVRVWRCSSTVLAGKYWHAPLV